jgi:aryl-alcohol dehydrogenase-like predicted oxidoreductase
MASNRLPSLGVGTWAWGDRGLWGYGQAYGEADLAEAFQTSLSAGVTLFDTAEVYGRGLSERILGRLAKDQPVTIATKFFPRLTASSVTAALQASLARLERSYVDLYQVHWPAPWLSNARLMALLAQAVHSGKARAIGVSNYSERQMRRAHRALASHGVALASNQVEYSLLRRRPEVNGVADACRELGVTLIAYSPLAMGALSGKYSADRPPSGARQLMRAFRFGNLRRAEPLLRLLRDLAKAKGATSSQVALRWLMDRGALPIPGAKNAAQAKENAGALHIALTPGERDELDRASTPWRR